MITSVQPVNYTTSSQVTKARHKSHRHSTQVSVPRTAASVVRQKYVTNCHQCCTEWSQIQLQQQMPGISKTAESCSTIVIINSFVIVITINRQQLKTNSSQRKALSVLTTRRHYQWTSATQHAKRTLQAI